MKRHWVYAWVHEKYLTPFHFSCSYLEKSLWSYIRIQIMKAVTNSNNLVKKDIQNCSIWLLSEFLWYYHYLQADYCPCYHNICTPGKITSPSFLLKINTLLFVGSKTFGIILLYSKALSNFSDFVFGSLFTLAFVKECIFCKNASKVSNSPVCLI